MFNAEKTHADALAKIHRKRGGAARPYWLFNRNITWRKMAALDATNAGLSDDDLHMLDNQRRNMDMREAEAVLFEGA